MAIARRPSGIALVRLGTSGCLLAGALASALACSIEHLPDTDTTSATAAREVVATRDSAAGTIERASDGVINSVVDSVPLAPVPESASRASVRDTSPIAASPTELAELAGTLVVPVQGVAPAALHDSYDEARGGRVHEALDIHAPRGTPVLAATDGRVLRLHESVPGGLMIYQADASDRFVLMYGHLERYAPGLADGMPLRRGQVIGYVGTSGNAAEDAPHLHFVIARGRPSASWWRGTPVNPYPLLARE